MGEIKSNSVQLITTSPPYSKIKDYGVEDQIGFTDTFEDYFKRLKVVWKECLRILEPQCRLIINVGDQYLRKSEYGRYRILSIASKIIEDCIELGFDYLGDINWEKISTTNTTGGCSLMGSIYYPRNGLITYDYEHILIFKKIEGKAKSISQEIKEYSKISLSEWKEWFVGHWKFSGVNQKEHIAMFPDELPYRLIRMFSFIGDTVVDPFLGSATTLKMAKSLFRKGIGYEINPDYKKVIETKVPKVKIGIYRDFQFLIYKLWQLAEDGVLSICFEEQRRNSIYIIEYNDNKYIVDYLLIEDNNLRKIIEVKLKENTVKNFLNGKSEKIIKYFIIIRDFKLSFIKELEEKLENKNIILITVDELLKFLNKNIFGGRK